MKKRILMLMVIIPIFFILNSINAIGISQQTTQIVNSTTINNAGVQLDIQKISYQASNGTTISTPFRLTQNNTTYQVETMEGSFVFNKNTCSLSTFSHGLINGTQPIINSDSYNVLAELNGTSNWINVSTINNALCQTTEAHNSTSVSITGTKSVAGAGVFSVTYTKIPTQNLKITFSVTNNNPTWTNYHIGLREKLDVPRNITLGNQTYDLSLFNNTVLDRNWIQSHNAQISKLGPHTIFDMGIGFNHVNDIQILWQNNQASLLIDYTYNTPILQPSQTITIDPSIQLDTTTSTSGHNGADPNSITLSMTITNNPNRVLVVGISTGDITAVTTVSSVQIGSSQFTQAVDKHDAVNVGGDAELWYLINPQTGGPQTIRVNFTSGNNYNYEIGAYSLYNVNQASPIGVTTTNTGASSTATTTLTPTHTGAWILDDLTYINAGSATASNTQVWNLNGGGNYRGASQYNNAPTINSPNSLTWGSLTDWATVGVEIIPNTGNTVSVQSLYNNATILQPTSITNKNSSLSQVINVNSTGWAVFTGLSGNQNFTLKETTDNFVVNKTLNDNISSGSTINVKSLVFPITCPLTGSKPVVEIKINDTDGTHITPETTPTCNSKNQIPWNATFVGNGNSPNTYTSKMLANILNTTAFGKNALSFSMNSSTISTSYSSPKITSSAITVGTGLQTKFEKYFLTLDGTPNQVTGVTATALTQNSISVNWSAGSGGTGPVSGYEIDQSIDGTTWTVLNSNTGTTTTSYTVTGLTSGATYYFRIFAINNSGTGHTASTSASAQLGGSSAGIGGGSGTQPTCQTNPSLCSTPPPTTILSVVINSTNNSTNAQVLAPDNSSSITVFIVLVFALVGIITAYYLDKRKSPKKITHSLDKRKDKKNSNKNKQFLSKK